MSSMNDEAVTYARVKDAIPKDFVSLNENVIAFGDDTDAAIMQDVPRRASFLFEGSEAPTLSACKNIIFVKLKYLINFLIF